MGTPYLRNILSTKSASLVSSYPATTAAKKLEPILYRWGNGFIEKITISGSFAKGTAVKGGTDIDLFISLSSRLTETLADTYNNLHGAMVANGYTNAKPQNVSINVVVDGMRVDLVPGRRQDTYSADHSLYRRRVGNWQKTNIETHIRVISQSGRQSEIKLMKLWRNQKGLDFPSFYLELSVIAALQGHAFISNGGDLSQNIVRVLSYLKSDFKTARIIDPANTNNVISEDLTATEKLVIAQAAERSLGGGWGQFVS